MHTRVRALCCKSGFLSLNEGKKSIHGWCCDGSYRYMHTESEVSQYQVWYICVGSVSCIGGIQIGSISKTSSLLQKCIQTTQYRFNFTTLITQQTRFRSFLLLVDYFCYSTTKNIYTYIHTQQTITVKAKKSAGNSLLYSFFVSFFG